MEILNPCPEAANSPRIISRELKVWRTARDMRANLKLTRCFVNAMYCRRVLDSRDTIRGDFALSGQLAWEI